MTIACLEHANITVDNPDELATLFCKLFDWKIRWSGAAKDDGYTVHVGSDRRYLALYTHPSVNDTDHNAFRQGTLNHIGLVVNDLENMEGRVLNNGYQPNNHRDYGPCRSFYFMADDRLEIEIIQYKE